LSSHTAHRRVITDIRILGEILADSTQRLAAVVSDQR